MSAKETAKEIVGREVDGVLACRGVDGSLVPHLFTADDIDEMAADCRSDERYPVALLARRLLSDYPELRLGVLARGCDERALVELAKQGQVDLARVKLLGLACDETLARACGCVEPYPTEVVEGERVEAAPGAGLTDRLDDMSDAERLDFWLGQFSACMKCYGCRNICPLCYCKDCALEDPELVGRGEVPPAGPVFHLIRALDMAGRCVDCGLCEEACPSGIPLRALYRKVGRVVYEKFGYRPGVSVDEKSPLAMLGTEKDVR